MATEDSNVDYWSLSPAQLAARIGLIANGATRAEASQLAEEWREAMNMPKATFQDKERQVALVDSLQRRTIEILVRTRQSN
jgi:head-tail adaptor